MSNTFQFEYTAATFELAQVLIGSSVGGTNACSISFDVPNNKVWLASDSGTSRVGSVVLGVPSTVQNSQCTIDGSQSYAVFADKSLTLWLSLTFTPAFAGTKSVYMNIYDTLGQSTGLAQEGTWTVGDVTSAQPPSVTVNVSPATSTVTASQTAQFAATVGGTTNTAVTWTVSPAVGTISSGGLYTAPSTLASAQTVTLTATSASDGTKAASATITLTPSVTVNVSPATSTVTANQTAQFAATVGGTTNTAVTWTVSPAVGAISSDGLYTAPSTLASTQTVTLTAMSAADGTKTASATITLTPSVTVNVSPATSTVTASQTAQFAATVGGTTNTAVTWTVSPAVGTISSDGLYTAPSTLASTQTVTLTAISAADGTKTASATIALAASSGVQIDKNLLWCSFSSASQPCNVSASKVIATVLDSSGRIGSGLRVCKGPGCPGASSFDLPPSVFSVRRGSISFWIRLNNNQPTSGPMELLSSYPGNPYILVEPKPSIQYSVSSMTPGAAATTLTLPSHGLTSGTPVRITGGSGRWAGISGDWTITRIDQDHFSVPLPSLSLGALTGSVQVLTGGQIGVSYPTTVANKWSNLSLSTPKFIWPAGEWQHIVWTWTADSHTMYMNGAVVASVSAHSPFPYEATFKQFHVGLSAGGTQDFTLDEFGTYNYEMTPREVQAAYQKTATGPIDALDEHGPRAIAVWAPGVRQVKLTVDSGNALESLAASYVVTVTKDGAPIHTETLDQTQVSHGFAEALIPLDVMTSGAYQVNVQIGSGGAVLSTPVYAYTQPQWLGNSLGMDNSVPAPYWDPIGVNGTTDLTVVNRKYVLAGGYGLPMQIVSMGQNLLATPVTLEIIQNGISMPVVPQDVQLVDVQPNRATWVGHAVAGSLAIQVNGSVEYDGMMLVQITLTPNGAVSVDKVLLKTNVRNEAAKYLFAVKDQPFWWFTWSIRPPVAVGEFNNNLSGTPTAAATDNIFSVVISDDDRGLQVFHNNMAGWDVDETQPWQRFIRNGDGTITYQCELVNHASTITRPAVSTIGYMGTPVKRLPDTWRLATGGAYGGTRAPESQFELMFDFTLGHSWSVFQVAPADPLQYLIQVAVPTRHGNVNGKKILPFTNAHVLVPTAFTNWTELQVLQNETENDGWNIAPSQGVADYWTWHLAMLLKDNAIDGYYIDESFTYKPSADLLSGGYIKPDGSHGIGMNMLAAREQFNRMGRMLVASGKSMNLWFHTTGASYPHVWSHGLMTLDGETPMSGTNYTVHAESPSNGDFFDFWNQNNSLLDRNQKGRGTWLLGIVQARKLGWIPNMWGGIECCSKPAAAIQKRRAECLFQMHDMLHQDQELNWWQMKYNFGIQSSDVTLLGYQTQQVVTTANPDVKATVYQRANSALAYIANFGSTDWTGNVNVDTAGMGWNMTGKSMAVKDAESSAATSLLNLAVPYHNCRILQFDLH